MNLRQAQKIIRDNELPSSEAARLLDQVDTHCLHFQDGHCNHIEECVSTEADDFTGLINF